MKLLHGFLFPRNGRYFSMTNITTQKLALGTLMALILALGVLSTADAQIEVTYRSGDLQTVTDGSKFNISFSARSDDRDDSIIITVTSGSVSIKKIGRHTEGVGAVSHTMYERNHTSYDLDTTEDSNKLSSSSVTVELSADAEGTAEITISNLTFTIYIVKQGHTAFGEVKSVGFTDLTHNTLVTSIGPDIEVPVPFAVSTADPFASANLASNVEVTLSVDGPGRLFVRGDDRDTSPKDPLVTSNSATVWLEMRRGTNRVTISSYGADPVTAVFMYGIDTTTHPITLVNDKQTGVKNGRLPNYLGAIVRDNNKRVVPDLIVTFGSSDGMFRPVPGTKVYVTDADRTWTNTVAKEITAELNDPDPVEATINGVFVKTNSSGEARIYYQIDEGATPADSPKTVTASILDGLIDRDFTIKIGTETPLAASLTIIDGDGQSGSARGNLEKPLIVRLESGSGASRRGVPSKEITFSTDRGFFTE